MRYPYVDKNANIVQIQVCDYLSGLVKHNFYTPENNKSVNMDL